MDHPAAHVTDFDFLAGDWTVVNRRLRQRWVGSDDWDEFEGTMRCRQHLGGVVNVDEMLCPDRGFSGMTVRVFDLEAKRWSISWINSTIGKLEPPVFGGFRDGVGRFAGHDTDGDLDIAVRFTWTVFDPDHARWQQAFSKRLFIGLDDDAHGQDDGEVNWSMDFTRVRA